MVVVVVVVDMGGRDSDVVGLNSLLGFFKVHLGFFFFLVVPVVLTLGISTIWN